MYALIEKHKKISKFDENAKKLIIVGYEEKSKACRLLDTKNDKIVICKDLPFLEDLYEDKIYTIV